MGAPDKYYFGVFYRIYFTKLLKEESKSALSNPAAKPARRSSSITPAPPFSSRSIQPIVEGFQISKSRNETKLSTNPSEGAQVYGSVETLYHVITIVSHTPAVSSMTMI